MRTTSSFAALAASLALLCAAPAARAGFDGATVSADYRWPDVATTLWAGGNAVVGAGVEFPDLGGFGVGVSPSVDVSGTGFTLSYPSGFNLDQPDPSITFDGLVLTDVHGTLPAFTGVSLVGSNIPGFGAAQLSFDADHVYVNQVGFTHFDAGATIEVAVNFAPVPEPATLLLMAAGVALLVPALRRRRG